MYKLKYYSLTKDEQYDLKEEFSNTEFGQNINKRLTRLIILGIMGLIFSIYLFMSHSNIWEIITASILLIFSLIFLIAPHYIKINKLNDYLIKHKKK